MPNCLDAPTRLKEGRERQDQDRDSALSGGSRVVGTGERRIGSVVEPNGEVTGKPSAVLDAAREAGDVEDKFEILGRAVDDDVQSLATRRVTGDNLPATFHDALFIAALVTAAHEIAARKLDGNRALVKVMKAVAWHERLVAGEAGSLIRPIGL